MLVLWVKKLHTFNDFMKDLPAVFRSGLSTYLHMNNTSLADIATLFNKGSADYARGRRLEFYDVHTIAPTDSKFGCYVEFSYEGTSMHDNLSIELGSLTGQGAHDMDKHGTDYDYCRLSFTRYRENTTQYFNVFSIDQNEITQAHIKMITDNIHRAMSGDKPDLIGIKDMMWAAHNKPRSPAHYFHNKDIDKSGTVLPNLPSIDLN